MPGAMASPGQAVAPGAERPPATVRREARAMGSPLRLQVRAGAPAQAIDAAWAAIVEEFELVEQALSRFRETSEIHRLRLAGGHADHPSRRLVAALVAADRARRLTAGRFDPRVLLDLERLGSAPLPIPPPLAAHALTSAPWQATPPMDRSGPLFTRDGRAGPIDVPDPVDFGGIGKGLALRWAATRAAWHVGTAPFLIEEGGDIVARGGPGPDGWRIGIERPPPVTGNDPAPLASDVGTRGDPGTMDDLAPMVVVELPVAGGAIATSSVRRARWHAADGRPVHHLLDPVTGEPGGDGLLAVTVAAADPAWAEVWSKTLFLEGRDAIASRARHCDLAAWWITDRGEIEMTPRARQLTSWVAGESGRTAGESG